jgi:hypothetical protein
MQSRRKILIIVVASILALLLAGAAALLVRGFLRLQYVDANLQGASETLTALYAQNPFPSAANLKLERENIKTIGEELLGLQSAMGEGQIEPIPQSPAKCITLFWETRNGLLARAGNTIKVDRGFDFGFGRHMKGELPAIPDVPRLTQQFKIVEALCHILYASKITALTAISRQEFEADAAPAAAPAKANTAITLKNVQDPAAGVIPAGQLFGRWHFAIQFTARESALMKVLNKMARSPVFIVVTRLELKGDDKVFDQKEAEAVAPRTEAEGGAEVKAAVKHRDARVVCGRDAVLNVKMELDVYQFARPKSSEPVKKAEGVK